MGSITNDVRTQYKDGVNEMANKPGKEEGAKGKAGLYNSGALYSKEDKQSAPAWYMKKTIFDGSKLPDIKDVKYARGVNGGYADNIKAGVTIASMTMMLRVIQMGLLAQGADAVLLQSEQTMLGVRNAIGQAEDKWAASQLQLLQAVVGASFSIAGATASGVCCFKASKVNGKAQQQQTKDSVDKAKLNVTATKVPSDANKGPLNSKQASGDAKSSQAADKDQKVKSQARQDASKDDAIQSEKQSAAKASKRATKEDLEKEASADAKKTSDTRREDTKSAEAEGKYNQDGTKSKDNLGKNKDAGDKIEEAGDAKAAKGKQSKVDDGDDDSADMTPEEKMKKARQMSKDENENYESQMELNNKVRNLLAKGDLLKSLSDSFSQISSQGVAQLAAIKEYEGELQGADRMRHEAYSEQSKAIHASIKSSIEKVKEAFLSVYQSMSRGASIKPTA